MQSYPAPALVRVTEMAQAAQADPARAVSFQGAPGCNGHRAALEWQPESKELLRALVSLKDAGAEEGDRADAMEKLVALETGPEAEALAIELAALRESLGDEEAAGRALEAGFRAHPSSVLLRERLEAAYRAHEEWTKLAELWVIDASVLADAAAVARLRDEVLAVVRA